VHQIIYKTFIQQWYIFTISFEARSKFYCTMV